MVNLDMSADVDQRRGPRARTTTVGDAVPPLRQARGALFPVRAEAAGQPGTTPRSVLAVPSRTARFHPEPRALETCAAERDESGVGDARSWRGRDGLKLRAGEAFRDAGAGFSRGVDRLPPSSHITVLTAPASETRIEAAAGVLRRGLGRGQVLLVGETREAADDLARDVAADVGATFGLHRFSLRQLAWSIATIDLARRGLAPATGLAAEAVATHATFEEQKSEPLGYLRPIAGFRSFGRTLAATLGDLRHANVDAGNARQLDRSGPDVARLGGRYAQLLEDARLVDGAALCRAAARVVRERAGGPGERAPGRGAGAARRRRDGRSDPRRRGGARRAGRRDAGDGAGRGRPDSRRVAASAGSGGNRCAAGRTGHGRAGPRPPLSLRDGRARRRSRWKSRRLPTTRKAHRH